jgi:hypothetical protein
MKIKKTYCKMGAAMTMGILAASGSAHAGPTSSPSSFSTISDNIGASIGSLPGMISGLAYLFGILLSVLGIMKIKDHVETPAQVHLKDGAIRLAAGGALFALPMITSAMLGTIGDGDVIGVAKLNKVTFGVGP